MTDNHDFKAALVGLIALRDSTALTPKVDEIYKEFYRQIPTIQFALRLADKLQKGEVSKEMENKGSHLRYVQDNQNCKNTANVFRAMTEKMMKEVGDEQ